MTEAVILEKAGHVAVLRLDREAQRNAMTGEMLSSFERRVAEVRADADVRVVIVTGTGRFFCSGADFRTSAELSSQSGMEGPAGMRESVKKIYAPFLTLLDVEVPVLAAINGHAIGGGLGLALACDVRIANADAKIGANFVRLGLHPGMAVTYVLPRLIGVERAAELLFTGRIITGRLAAEYGLVSTALEPADVMPRARALADEIAGAAPYAVRLTKRSLYDALGHDPGPTVEIEAFAQSLCSQTTDAREGISALLEKREPRFKGK